MGLSTFTANQGTQTGIIVDNIGGSVMAIQKVDISPLGAEGTIWNGTVGVSSLPNTPGGTINNVGTALGMGTVTSIGQVNNAGTLQAGTVNAGTTTIANVAGLFPQNAALGDGDANPTTTKIGAMMMGFDGVSTWYRLQTANGATDNLGTAGIGAISAAEMRVLNGGTAWARVPGDGTNGIFSNVKILPNLPGGTLNAGTVRQDARTTQNIVSFGTQIANSGAAAATIVGSTAVGIGTSLWLQDLSIINPNANVVCVLGFGTAQQGTNVLFRGNLGTASAAGIEKAYGKAVNAGMTNQDLVFSTTAAGTVDLSISYFISA